MASSPRELKGIKPKFLHSEEAIMNAMHAINAQNMSFRKASFTFGVHHTTLENKVNGKSQREKKMGLSSILTAIEEDTLEF